MFKALDSCFSIASGCFRVNRTNFKSAIATSLNLGVKMKDKIFRGRESSFSDTVPVRITEKILLGSILDDFGWKIFRNSSVGDPR